MISGLEFERFALNNRFAAEDEAAAREDAARQQVWYEEAKGEADALRADMALLVDANGNVIQDKKQEHDNLKQ